MSAKFAEPLRVPPIPRAVWAAAKIPPFRKTLFATILEAAADRLRVPRGDYCRIALSLAKERHRGRSRKSSNRFYARRGHPGATLPLTDHELLDFEAGRLRLSRWQYWQLGFRLELERRPVPDRPLSEIRTRQGPVRR